MPAPAASLGSDNFDTGPTGTMANLSSTSSGLTRPNGVNYQGFYNESSGIGYENVFRSNGSGEPDTIGSGGVMMGGPSAIFSPALSSGFEHGLRINFGSITGITQVSFDYSAFRILNPSDAFVYSTSAVPIQLRLAVFSGGSWTPFASMPVLTVATGTTTANFIGFITAGEISSVKILIDSPGSFHTNRVIIDNLTFGTAAASGPPPGGGGGGEPPPSGGGEIPEPSTYLLCAVGLLGVVFFRRSRS